MNLEILLARALEIETAITNMTAQLQALHGHKAETSHWIEQIKAAAPVNETQVEVMADPVLE